ncbi:uncharacterized protein LOC128638212 [Bombina bombina]|uniref:uncharacterized protein LOC128638212 n=1 Tax=Bombina bombina TaxID=8345 RepID=UPI00235AC609|nr:uncharacterized protein LOC128638212 [Bombina bombina]
MQREAVLHFQSKTQHQLLLSFFCRWKNKFLSLKKKQHYRTLETLKSVQRWRAATRGRQALNLHSSSSVKEACNYWTNVSSISLHRRNHHATIGSKKMKKVILSIALTIREQRELGCIRLKSNTEWLLQSAFCSWLLTYRRQGAQPALADTNTYTDSSGVYLTEHNTSPPCQEHARELNHKGGLTERMHKFQLRCKINELRKTWLHWKGLYSTQLVLRELERQRLLKNSWNVWRRRYLQSCTTQQVLAREERCLLYQIFTKWRQNTNRSKKNKYGYTEL